MGSGEGVMTEEEEKVVEFLRERDVACPGCRYNLRNLTRARCPECGQGLEFGLVVRVPRMGAWILGLVGLVGGRGMGCWR